MTNKEWDDVVKQVSAMKDVQKCVGLLIDVFSDMSTSLAGQLPEGDAKTALLNFYSQAKSNRKDLVTAVTENIPHPAERKKKR